MQMQTYPSSYYYFVIINKINVTIKIVKITYVYQYAITDTMEIGNK